MNPVAQYLDRLHEVRGTKRGTPELSYRAALENLLNAVGGDLDPPVHATAELADTGSGHPDFGLLEKKSGNLRAVVEVKSPGEEVPATADGKQVAKYWKHYGHVLVTNYRDFLLVVRQPDGRVRVEGRYPLAQNAEAFWTARPGELAKEHAEGLTDFLRGVLTRSAPITRPQDLADDLARHAREARRRLFRQDVAALAPLRAAMEQALGLHFDDRDGLDFFRSSLVQTLFYGLFSGWMLWRQGRHTAGDFDWKDASDYLALPLIGDLYEEIARPKRLADLGLREPLEWATTSLNRVAEDEFFARFDADHAITLFYEPFLQAFDPKLRKQFGVWYTPPEIVKYMVGRVDQLLRTELKIADGLADDSVYVLDPAAGTGSYVIEVARRIHQTLTDQGHGALAAAGVKKALCSRVFGFEILAAPYVVAHLQLGVLLRSLGAALATDERCEVYLTNSLTGWEPPKGAKATLSLFPELQKEAERASKVKREKPILVILGNPPYDGFAGVAQGEERDLIKPYFVGLEEFEAQARGLNELYVRFFRLAERRISEIGKRGIVCYISNSSWLNGQSHPVMRKRLLGGFDSIWIDNLHGDRNKSERAPDGRASETIFAMQGASAGIKVGTAIGTFVKHEESEPSNELATVRYQDLEESRADDRRKTLLASISEDNPGSGYTVIVPAANRRYAFTPGEVAEDYGSWPSIADLTRHIFNGIKTCRDDFLIDIDRPALLRRMADYFSPSITDAEMSAICPSAMDSTKRFKAAEIRAKLRVRGFRPDWVVRLAYRPFDNRWLFWELDYKLLDEKRIDFATHVFPENVYLITSNEEERLAGFDRAFLSDAPCELHLLRPDACPIPLWLRPAAPMDLHTEPNFKPALLQALCTARGQPAFKKDGVTHTPMGRQCAESFFYHTLAVLWSPAYREENEAALRQDWPRVPIPADPAVLDASAKLGRAIADLLLTERPVPGVTTGKLRPELRNLAVPSRADGGPINPNADLKIEAGWGFRTKKSAINYGTGKETPHPGDLDGAVDVYLNDRVFWANVPADVWAATIGGHPVLKKWLSYREFKILGRPLRQEEMTHFTGVARRLKALLLLAPDLDANYRAASAETLVL